MSPVAHRPTSHGDGLMIAVMTIGDPQVVPTARLQFQKALSFLLFRVDDCPNSLGKVSGGFEYFLENKTRPVLGGFKSRWFFRHKSLTFFMALCMTSRTADSNLPRSRIVDLPRSPECRSPSNLVERWYYPQQCFIREDPGLSPCGQPCLWCSLSVRPCDSTRINLLWSMAKIHLRIGCEMLNFSAVIFMESKLSFSNAPSMSRKVPSTPFRFAKEFSMRVTAWWRAVLTGLPGSIAGYRYKGCTIIVFLI